MSDEYYEFRNGRRYTNNLFSTIIKSLIVVILLLSVIVLAIFSYKYLFPNTNQTTKIVQKPLVQQKSTGLKKEDIALIVKSIMLEMKAQNSKVAKKQIKNRSKDEQLLSSLQSAEVDTITKRKVKKVKKVKPKIITKKIKKQVKKRYVTYNAVVINKKEIRNTSDLAKLYATINKIAKKKKKKVLSSAYTKKIRKEIGARKNSMRTIKVRSGDTLGSLAIRAYGDAKYYRKIFRANPDLVNNPNKISVGQILRVPK